MINNMIALSSGNVEVVIDAEHGARLSSVRFGGTELLVQRTDGDSFSWGCYPMAPWAGRIRNGIFEHQGSSVQLPINSAPTRFMVLCMTLYGKWSILHQQVQHCELISISGGLLRGGSSIASVSTRRR